MSGQATPGRSQSLYRKYRPASFDEQELVGQEHVSRTLRNAVRYDRVAHAYLFCGPRGTGKTSSARLLAKAVNCEDADPARRPCNTCPSCRTINEGRAVDIIEIDAASNRGIEDMRDLREKVKFVPAQLRHKFYIIDEVHQLTKEAANALLKTLEEPPPHVGFILATTDQEKVLETISSRCQTFVFHRIPVGPMIEQLRRVCAREGLRADDEALAAIARAATGSLRDALGLLDQLASYGDEGITAEMVRQVLGAGGGDQVLALIDAVAASDVAAGLQIINAAVEGGADARQFAAQLVEYLRALLHAAAAPARGARQGGAGEAVAVSPAHRDAFTLAEIASLVKRFSQVDYGIRHSAYGHLPLELCLVDCVLARGAGAGGVSPAVEPAPPAPAERRATGESPAGERGAGERIPSGESGSAPQPARVPTPIRVEGVTPTATGAASAAPAATIEQVHDAWPRIRQGVKAINRRIEALLSSSDPYQVEGGVLTIVAAFDFHRNKLNEEECRRVVAEVVSQVLGGTYRVTCVSRDEADAASALRVTAAAPATVTPAPPRAAQSAQEEAAPQPAPPVAVRPPEVEEGAPWDEPAPAPTRPGNGTIEAAGSTPPAAADTPAPRAPEVDERYLKALGNLFNAVEIKA